MISGILCYVLYNIHNITGLSSATISPSADEIAKILL